MATEETAEESAVQVHKEGKSRAARPRGHVKVFGTWCKGCGICVEFCPQGVLTMDSQGRPVVAFPEKCTACHWCDTHCPDLAIIVRRLEPEEVKELTELAELAGQGAAPAVQPGPVHSQEGGER